MCVYDFLLLPKDIWILHIKCTSFCCVTRLAGFGRLACFTVYSRCYGIIGALLVHSSVSTVYLRVVQVLCTFCVLYILYILWLHVSYVTSCVLGAVAIVCHDTECLPCVYFLPIVCRVCCGCYMLYVY